MPTAPRTGSGCHRSVCRTDETFAALPAGEAHVRFPRPPCRPRDQDQHMGSPPIPLANHALPQEEPRAHMVCSRGFPRKAFSGMALMLLLWKPLGNNTGIRGTPGHPPTARQEGWGQRDTAGDPPPGSATLGKESQCAGGGGEGGEEQAQTPGRARGGVQRDRGSRKRHGPQGEAGLVSRP